LYHLVSLEFDGLLSDQDLLPLCNMMPLCDVALFKNRA